MGVNEKGLAIGNQAVWTRMPLSRKGGLTGMDLLRLALERTSGAPQALELIVRLLSDYGQGGLCGYEDRRMAYHNSFLLADPREAWVLETAGSLWAARRVRDLYAISNALSIGESFDESHPDLIPAARRNGWLKRGRDFHFAGCFADRLYTRFSAAAARQGRVLALLEKERGKILPETGFRILRDHGNGDYRPDRHLLGNRVCAHAANPLFRNATQTTGSLVAHLQPGRINAWATGTAAPCTGIFKPIWLDSPGLPEIEAPVGATCDLRHPWWFHERLHRSVLGDFAARSRRFQAERQRLEQELVKAAAAVVPERRKELTERAFRLGREATAEWIEQVQTMPATNRPGRLYRLYWVGQNRRAGMAQGAR